MTINYNAFLTQLSIPFRSVSQSEVRLFIAAFLIVFLINLFGTPSLGFQAEPWAETGTNYLRYGLTDSFFTNMARTDAGYLVLFPRFLSYWLTRFDFVIFHFPLIAQLLAQAGIALFAGLVIFAKLNPFLSRPSYRFLLALLIGLYPGYELRSYVNFVYYAYPLLILAVFWDFGSFRRFRGLILLILVVMLFASKGLFVIFLPLLFIRLVWELWRRRGWENILFSFLATTALFWQLKVMLANNAPSTKAAVFSLGTFITEWLPYCFHLFSSLFLRRPPVFIAFFLSLGVLFWTVFRAKKIADSEGLMSQRIFFICGLIFLCTGTLFINYIVSLKEEFILPISVHFWDVGAPQMGRQYIGINLAIIMLLLTALQFAGRRLRLTLPLFAILLVARCEYFEFSKADKYKQAEENFSHWAAFRDELGKSEYFIPLNPYPWYLSKGGKVQNIGFSMADQVPYNIPLLGVPKIIAVTFSAKCQRIGFSDGKGSMLNIEEVGRKFTGQVRRHRIFDFKDQVIRGQNLQVKCRDEHAPRGMDAIVFYGLPR